MAEQKPEEEQKLKKLMEEMRKKEYAGLTEEEVREKERQKQLRKQKNREQLDETLKICEEGGYEKNGNRVELGLSLEKMKEIRVFLPEEIRSFTDEEPERGQMPAADAPCLYSCENTDAFSLAERKCSDPAYTGTGGKEKILILNLASPSRPGGGVREGSGGQEEDLCRRSSLLLSLESETAKKYYEYNKTLHTRLGSDAVMITEHAVIFRDAKGERMDRPFYAAVMTCAAPMVRMGLEGKTEQEYEELLYRRITGMLRCAWYRGYKNLILGAFGCGAFGNDAAKVSDVFRRAADDLTDTKGNKRLGFKHLDFAVLCSPGKEYNYNEFYRNFGAR